MNINAWFLNTFILPRRVPNKASRPLTNNSGFILYLKTPLTRSLWTVRGTHRQGEAGPGTRGPSAPQRTQRRLGGKMEKVEMVRGNGKKVRLIKIDMR